MCKEDQEPINYNIKTTPYTAAQVQKLNGTIPKLKPLNGFMGTNIGDTIVWVNGVILYPGVPGTSIGDSVSFGGNAGEVFVEAIKVVFASPVGANPRIEISQKFYV